jgi:transposase InsO family protein
MKHARLSLLQCSDVSLGSTAADLSGVGDDANGRNCSETGPADRLRRYGGSLLIADICVTVPTLGILGPKGSQFTGSDFTGVLATNGIRMDGKGAWRDNVFVERLWRSFKYEEVYMRAYDGVSKARTSIGRYLNVQGIVDGTSKDAYMNPFSSGPFVATAIDWEVVRWNSS